MIYISGYFNVILNITDSLFLGQNGKYYGVIFYVDWQGSQINVMNSNFTQNAALEGGVFRASYSSTFYFYNTTFISNFGI